VAISPREAHQWDAWLGVMGSPEWASDARFITKRDRVANWDALHALISAWSTHHDKRWIADTAQRAHVPSFPLCEPAELLQSAQLEHRRFYRSIEMHSRPLKVPGPPFALSFTHDTHSASTKPPGPLPLSGVRVLDFSWVIAGPTTTRYLAAMGADVIKVEAPGRGDPARATELHTVLGQAKRSIVLNLKQPEGADIARRLAAKCDVLVENFATGVMDRLGLGPEALQAINPSLIFVSASGLGRTGPEAGAVAYGTLLQCYAGFAGLNRHPDVAPRVGFAWLDPMCGLMLAFTVAAAIWRRRRSGHVARVDYSMLEAMLWTMAEPLLVAQLSGPLKPVGYGSDLHAPHGVYRCAGEDEWISLAITSNAEWRVLCEMVPGLSELGSLDRSARAARQEAIDTDLSAWLLPQRAPAAAELLRRRGIAAAALATSHDLVESAHLHARGFWEARSDGVLPRLPWCASFGRANGAAPGLGADTVAVLRDVVGLSEVQVDALRQVGAIT